MNLIDNIITWIPDVVGEYGPITITVIDGGEDNSEPAIEYITIIVEYDYTVATYGLAEGNNLISFYSSDNDIIIPVASK